MDIDFKKINVLLVVDAFPLKRRLTSALTAGGFGTIITADNQQEAIVMMCHHSPDLVLADWDAPSTRSTELIKEIRHNPLIPDRTVPILLVTADTTFSRITEARNVGVSGFLLKPFSVDDLVNRVTRVMGDPRDFIDCPTYCGPDRRRKNKPDYAGPFRRAADA